MMMRRREVTLVLLVLISFLAVVVAVPLHAQDEPSASSTEFVDVNSLRTETPSAAPRTSTTPLASSTGQGTSEAAGGSDVSPSAACVPDGQRHVDCDGPESSESIPSLNTLASDAADKLRDRTSTTRPAIVAVDDEDSSFLDRKDVQRFSLLIGNISSIATIVALVLAGLNQLHIVVRW
ncbi:hypothetical protein BKA62DRAFT_489166 [Auriculariales sp. MPI-PUGE-AT-0066]|nr:hypothetical protein BKA62DRAFT_489166 [Auriculariales sp. MPI-PUGE-AT-0066]